MIMLVGIVKKNAIMMIDFALARERDGSMRSGNRDHGSGRDPLPADHDDHHGGAVWAPCRSPSDWAPAAKAANRSALPSWAD